VQQRSILVHRYAPYDNGRYIYLHGANAHANMESREGFYGVIRHVTDPQTGIIHLDNTPLSLDLNANMPLDLSEVEELGYYQFFPYLVEFEIQGEIEALSKEGRAHLIDSICIFLVFNSGDSEGLNEAAMMAAFQKATQCREFHLTFCFLPGEGGEYRGAPGEGGEYRGAMASLSKLLRTAVRGLPSIETLTLRDCTIQDHAIGWKSLLSDILAPSAPYHHEIFQAWLSSQCCSVIPAEGARIEDWFRRAKLKTLCLQNIRMSPITSQFFWRLVGCFHLEHLKLIDTVIEWPDDYIFPFPIPMEEPGMLLEVMSGNRAQNRFVVAFVLEGQEDKVTIC